MSAFFFWMLVSSGLGFLKMLALAQILARPDFGHYVSLIGAAMLSGVLFSFGLVEGTTKRYPRMWVAGLATAVVSDAKSISTVLAKRFAVATLLAALLAAFLPLGYSPVDLVMAGIVGLCTALLALAASLLRAADSPRAFQVFSVTRSALSFVIACAGGAILGWRGAIGGEAVAGVLAVLAARVNIGSAFAAAPREPTVTRQLRDTAVDRAGGAKLYWATLSSSSTSLGDRALINALSGASLAGAYGVVALIFQIGQLLVNILSQRVGPLIIKAGFSGDDLSGAGGSVRAQWAALGGAVLALVAIVLGFRAINFPPGFFAKYSISAVAILGAGLVAVLQIYALLEFYLLAHDREDAVLACSVTASVLFFSLFSLAGVMQLSLEWFVFAAALARGLHVGMLATVIRRVRT